MQTNHPEILRYRIQGRPQKGEVWMRLWGPSRGSMFHVLQVTEGYVSAVAGGKRVVFSSNSFLKGRYGRVTARSGRKEHATQ